MFEKLISYVRILMSFELLNDVFLVCLKAFRLKMYVCINYRSSN